ncbi:MAG: hypothetical protein Q4A85_06405 [Kingella sp. (in: b-proteobacteria)]|nr:hypothetical protein [Kingella sp. (in: b-proteobacteria)]
MVKIVAPVFRLPAINGAATARRHYAEQPSHAHIFRLPLTDQHQGSLATLSKSLI